MDVPSSALTSGSRPTLVFRLDPHIVVERTARERSLHRWEGPERRREYSVAEVGRVGETIGPAEWRRPVSSGLGGRRRRYCWSTHLFVATGSIRPAVQMADPDGMLSGQTLPLLYVSAVLHTALSLGIESGQTDPLLQE